MVVQFADGTALPCMHAGCAPSLQVWDVQGAGRVRGLRVCLAAQLVTGCLGPCVNLSSVRAAAEPAAEAAPAADAAAATAEAAPAEAAPARAPALRRLWLTGSLGASPGAFGFFRTAHAEPLGDRLRLLLDYDLPSGVPPVDGTRVAVTGAPRPPPPRPEMPPRGSRPSCSAVFTTGQVSRRSTTALHGRVCWGARARILHAQRAAPGCRATMRRCASVRPRRSLKRCRGGAQAWGSGWRAWRRWTWRRTCSRAACGARCGGRPRLGGGRASAMPDSRLAPARGRCMGAGPRVRHPHVAHACSGGAS
jgi:hypothetical protein